MSWRNAVSGAGGRMTNANRAAAMAAFENRRLRAGGVEPGSFQHAILSGQMALANAEPASAVAGVGGAGGHPSAMPGIGTIASQMAQRPPPTAAVAEAGPPINFSGLVMPAAHPSAHQLGGLPFFGAPLVPGGGAAAAAQAPALLPGLPGPPRPVAPNPENARYAADPAQLPRDIVAYRRAMVEWLMANDPTNPNLAQLQRELAMMETSGMMFGFGGGRRRRRKGHRKSRKGSRKHKKASRKNRK